MYFGRMPPPSAAPYRSIVTNSQVVADRSPLPAGLVSEPEPDGAHRIGRSRRDWTVDVLCFLLAIALTLLTLLDGVEQGLAPVPLTVDLVLGGLCCLGVWLRRRWPVGLAVIVGLFSVYSMAASGVALIALFTVAVHRRFAVVGPIAAGYALISVSTPLVRPDLSVSHWSQVVLGVVCVVAVLALGMFVRARRQSLHELPALGMAAVAEVNAPVRVLIVDDDPLVRAGLAMIIGGARDLAVVGEAADGSEVATAVDAYAPDVVLMDIRMPTLDGLAATELLRARPDPPEVIVLTTFDTDEHVLRALRAGASGFLLKHTPPAEILRAISRVSAGEPILSPTVTRQLIAHIGHTGADARQRHARTVLGQLSEREREVAMAVARGRSNAEISSELFMSVTTVKAHVSRILTKLNLNNRTQIALLAHDAGLTG
jgi:DNA-binding NarL/FixJ family response regulator